MRLKRELGTGHGLLDEVVGSFLYFLLSLLGAAVLRYVPQFLPKTGNQVLDWLVYVAVIGLSLALTIWGIIKIYWIWTWRSARAGQHMKELKAMLKAAHPGVRPLLAYIAKESAAHLEAAALPGGIQGEDVTIREYIRLLEESIEYPGLRDATFIALAKPSLWGDHDDSNLSDHQRQAWRYFDRQAEIKKRSGAAVNFRRFLAISPAEYTTDTSNLRDKFVQRHQDAQIDLFLLPPSFLTADLRNALRDMAVFWGDDGKHGWVIWSDFDATKLSLGIVRVCLVHHRAALMNRYSDFLREVFTLMNHPENKLAGLWNKPPNDFLKRIEAR